MSPSEEQLRAALKHGEGPGPDVEKILRSAVRAQQERRDRWVRSLSAAAAVIVVAGIAVAITRHTDRTSSAPLAQTAAPNAPPRSSINGAFPGGAAASGGTAVAGGAGVSSPASTATCPAAQVRYALPGGGGTDQFGASGPLADKPVTSFVFCQYSEAGAFVRQGELGGPAAQEFLTTVESAPSTNGNTEFCLTARPIEILPVATDGTSLTPWSVTGLCRQVQITDGTAVRYVSTSVLDAATRLASTGAAGSSGPSMSATTGGVTGSPTSGGMSGSPAR